MEFYPINLLYFVIVIPVIILAFFILKKSCRDKKHLLIIMELSILLFYIRFCLIFFRNTIGIMPYLVEDTIFYTLLVIFGVIFTFFYIYRIEKVSFKDIGGKVESVKKSIVYGLIGFIPLILMFPLIILLTEIRVSIEITFSKLIVTFSFTLLAAIYEELMFRGIIQNHIRAIINNNGLKVVIYTSLIFTITHLFYLPFTGFGIFYIFVFIMSILLSFLRNKTDLLACAVLHGGIVFILILFV